MQQITPNYTKYYNGKYERKGHLFPKRFRSVYVERALYLTRLTRYINLLPERLGLAPGFRDYAYSSYSAFAGAQEATPGVSINNEVRQVVSSLGIAQLENPYERYMLSADKNEIAFFEKKLSRGYILGSAQFTAAVKAAINKEETKAEVETVKVPEDQGELVNVRPGEMPRSSGTNGRTAVLSGALLCTVALSAFSVSINQQALRNVPAVMEPMVQVIAGPVLETGQTIARATPNTMTWIEPVAEPIKGTTWEIDLYTVDAEGSLKPIRDRIVFDGKSFVSSYFSSQGFKPSNYTVTTQANGIVTWETMQMNAKGEMISWRGDFIGGKMEGVLSLQTGNQAKDFQFMSNQKTQIQMVQHG